MSMQYEKLIKPLGGAGDEILRKHVFMIPLGSYLECALLIWKEMTPHKI